MFPSAYIQIDDVIKLLLAILVGGLIGIERELRDKDAGFRTLIFICAGSTLFTIFSLRLSVTGDPTRVASNIVSGVGFLGAGVILRERGQVRGLTTASTIWLAAALGMGIGGGHYWFALAATGFVLMVLWIFPFFERFLERHFERRTYEIVCRPDDEKYRKLEAMLCEHRLKITDRKYGRRGANLHFTWNVYGSGANHRRAVEALLADADVLEFNA